MSQKIVICIIAIIAVVALGLSVGLVYKERQEKNSSLPASQSIQVPKTTNETQTPQPGTTSQIAQPGATQSNNKPQEKERENQNEIIKQQNVPSSSFESMINVISPNGGEKWKWGTTQEIKWSLSPDIEKKIDTKEITTVSIDIHSQEGSWYIYSKEYPNKDFTSLKWQVGNAQPMPGGFGQSPYYEENPQPLPNKQYKIRVCYGTSESFYKICDESNASFLIFTE